MKTARAPGKLILSGEHAVVYGAPAIAVAVNRYATATALTQVEALFSLELLNLSYHKSMTKKALKKIKNRLSENYESFKRGEQGIKEVLKLPFELSQFALSHFLEKMNHQSEHGLKLTTHSDIPMGCGMGSSAAMILAVMHALALAEGKVFDKEFYYQSALDAENLQHGRSSGVDIRVSLQGGCLMFQQNTYETLPIEALPFWVINTGKPLSSTGHCVESARSYFDNSHFMDDFSSVTLSLSKALKTHDKITLMDAIRENHRLLCAIGVVPQKIQQFIEQLENAGFAAKICGAGSVIGDTAGIVMIVAEQSPEAICQKAGYVTQRMMIDYDGLQ
jgi:mevalonate kinase